ncbi:alpha/beta fold hydrolase [Streptomyces mirabilis]|uniref:Pimeloyl-ACP methyl ester carboxylesterase n=1 Tax=Streptomyces mirabilis TaxID=68239 RepID=A0A1I2NT05_9ACTN|nr:alpha/beta hydrolase [Streptomyces mirabilis]SFG06868.1 Pimeloyl-ACP methyl ester carboxylesterase [Streptomyces mirabilis]
MRDGHYDVRGSGPRLLIIPGGAGHPMGLEGAVTRLSERFTVVTYDPLGLSRGPLDGPVGDQRVQVWSDRAHQLLDSLLPDGESARVFGSSSGGIVALDLLARYPERLRRVVAHEPPSIGVLPDAARQHAMITEVYEIHRTEGVAAATARLTAGLEGRSWEPGPRPAPAAADGGENTGSTPESQGAQNTPMDIFLGRVLRPFTSHALDLDALKALSSRLTLGAGSDSRGQLPFRTAALLAELSGGDFVEFPGGHLGVLQHPVAFADRLAEAL